MISALGRRLLHSLARVRQRSTRQLRVAETLSVGEKRQLLIVECGVRRLLIGTAGNFMTTLADLGTKPAGADET